MNFVCSGHFGDLYIVICKLYAFHLRYPSRQIRLTRCVTVNSPHDRQTNDFARQFSWLSYSFNASPFAHIDQILLFASSQKAFYVSPWMDGIDLYSREYSDAFQLPLGIAPLQRSSTHTLNKQPKVLIHLQSGKWPGNFKYLSERFLRTILEVIGNNAEIVITGLTEHMPARYEIPKAANIIDYRNRFSSINQWIDLCQECDLVIAPEGFNAFFALSISIPTIIILTIPNVLRRTSIRWLARNSFIIVFKEYTIHSKIRRRVLEFFSPHYKSRLDPVISPALADFILSSFS